MSTPLRNIDPAVERRVTQREEVLRRKCRCGAPVVLTIPAGTPLSIAKLGRASLAICESCYAAQEAEEERVERERHREQRVRQSGLPRTLCGLTWESYDVSYRGAVKAVESARRWAANTREPKRGLLVCGPVGVGKTRLAATAAWELMLHRNGVRWVSVPELIIRLSASFGDRDRGEAMKVLTGRGPLVLDDVDKIKPSGWVLSNLFTAIDSRYQAGAPLFVTSNLPPQQLADYFAGGEEGERRVTAEAIVSRLVEFCHLHQIIGPDRRRGA